MLIFIIQKKYNIFQNKKIMQKFNYSLDTMLKNRALFCWCFRAFFRPFPYNFFFLHSTVSDYFSH